MIRNDGEALGPTSEFVRLGVVTRDPCGCHRGEISETSFLEMDCYVTIADV